MMAIWKLAGDRFDEILRTSRRPARTPGPPHAEDLRDLGAWMSGIVQGARAEDARSSQGINIMECGRKNLAHRLTDFQQYQSVFHTPRADQQYFH